MEAHRLVRIVAVIVVPVEQRARRLRGQLQRVHAHHAAPHPLRRRWNQVLAHHAHHRARHHAEIFFQRSPALHRADRQFASRCIQPSITAPSLAILISAAFGNAARSDILLDRRQLGFVIAVVILQPAMRPRISDRSMVSTEMPLRLQQLFAVAHGVKCCRPSANRADAQVAQSTHHAADSSEPGQILFEAVGAR